ncbi:hypothetical protein B0H19DRAFT_1146499 [Mycena capillaripes]|nr:hypothetical protein B0H19DRAFT_1146499 [Mycena capillaripes]
MLSLRHLFLIANVVWGVCGDDLQPRPHAQLLTQLKPQTYNLLAQTQSKRQTTIPGLLVSRFTLDARACPGGYGLCANGRCCVAGSDCCKVGCCDPGNWCYATGCCKLSEGGCDNLGCCPLGDNCCKGGGCCAAGDNCVIVDGHKGCCPIGKTCTGSPGQCDISGYVPCANDDFCCLPGDTCFRDSNNNPGCRGSGGGSPPTTTPITTTHKTTTTPPTTTPETPTTTDDNSKTSSSTPASTGTGTAPNSPPPPPSGSKNVVIDVSSSTEITWTGDWFLVPSTCSSGSKAKRCSGNSSVIADGIMGYFFTGSSIYLSVASTNAQYIVTIDGETTNFGGGSSDAIAAPANCTFGWSKTNLVGTGQHFLQISILGAIDDTKRDFDAPWSLDIQNLVITQPGSLVSGAAGSTGSSATASAKAGGDDDPNLNAASTNFVPRLSFVSLTIFATVILCL